MDDIEFCVFMFRGVVNELRREHGRGRVHKHMVVFALKVAERQIKAARNFDRANSVRALWKLVERSTTLNDAYQSLLTSSDENETQPAPVSNTGVTDLQARILEDYVAGSTSTGGRERGL